ncbi:hypothetical protein EDS67_08525 [candidate division KSB1 bacterium]|nr:MAG: hypothetical protein EDS67_08525 [candidate division KSB1 bacterium]MBC6952444.1 hypothetical protein [candidate division KSB1 bacterium]MCE7944687.1 hypothetical protein [Chlorobi bacterium CHB1]
MVNPVYLCDEKFYKASKGAKGCSASKVKPIKAGTKKSVRIKPDRVKVFAVALDGERQKIEAKISHN